MPLILLDADNESWIKHFMGSAGWFVYRLKMALDIIKPCRNFVNNFLFHFPRLANLTCFLRLNCLLIRALSVQLEVDATETTPIRASIDPYSCILYTLMHDSSSQWSIACAYESKDDSEKSDSQEDNTRAAHESFHRFHCLPHEI